MGVGVQHGHYFSILGKKDNLWIRANDTTIDSVDIYVMKAHEGTIFFYEQINQEENKEIYDNFLLE